MNLDCLKRLSKLDPALARAVNNTIWWVIIILIITLLKWWLINWETFFAIFSFIWYVYFDKRIRDDRSKQ
jgi:hypothetical protein